MSRTHRVVAGIAVLGAVGAFAFLVPGHVAEAGTEARAQARIELGRRLFFDPTVSREGTLACAGCHDPEQGFSDPREFPIDENGVMKRHSQPLLDLHGDGFHWDGEFRTVRELLVARLGTPDLVAAETLERLADRIEAAQDPGTFDLERLRRKVPQTIASPGPYGRATTPSGRLPQGRPRALTGAVTKSVPSRLASDDRYARGFRLAFGSPGINADRIADSLGAYLASLTSTESPYDRFLAGDPRAMSPAAERGFELFVGKASCASCHTVRGSSGRRALSDGLYHNTGVALDVDRVRQRRGGEPDAGRTEVSLQRQHHARFKTPNLRDVALRAPYMHDGSFKTLEEVVLYYARGGTPNDNLDPAVHRIGLADLTDRDVADLVAFLKALTGDERPGLGELPEYRPARVRVRLLDLWGRPKRSTDVTVRPMGDRLRGTDAMPDAFEVRTGRDGYTSFPFPASTHVMLEVDGHTVGLGRPLPDFTGGGTFLVTPKDTVAVRIRTRKGVRLPSEIRTHPTKRMGPRGGGVDGAETVLRRLRPIGSELAIYTTKAPTARARSFHTLTSQQSPGFLGTFRIDMTGGSLTHIDLRPDREDKQLRDRAEQAVNRYRKALPGEVLGQLQPGPIPFGPR